VGFELRSVIRLLPSMRETVSKKTCCVLDISLVNLIDVWKLLASSRNILRLTCP